MFGARRGGYRGRAKCVTATLGLVMAVGALAGCSGAGSRAASPQRTHAQTSRANHAQPTAAPTTTRTDPNAPTTLPSTGSARLSTTIHHLTTGGGNQAGGWRADLKLTGAHPGEKLLFDVLIPDGQRSQQFSHVAGSDGTVVTSYLSYDNDPTGRYVINAHGDDGTQAGIAFDRTATTFTLAQ
jgi:hypothetical protein